MKFFVACAKGLEYLLVDELLAMGATRATAATAGANVEGVDALAYRAAMFSRLVECAPEPVGFGRRPYSD